MADKVKGASQAAPSVSLELLLMSSDQMRPLLSLSAGAVPHTCLLWAASMSRNPRLVMFWWNFTDQVGEAGSKGRCSEAAAVCFCRRAFHRLLTHTHIAQVPSQHVMHALQCTAAAQCRGVQRCTVSCQDVAD